MTWQVETMVRLKDNRVCGFTVGNNVGGDATLPVEILFDNRNDAVELARWLKKKDHWIQRLELIIEMETNIDIEQLKEKELME